MLKEEKAKKKILFSIESIEEKNNGYLKNNQISIIALIILLLFAGLRSYSMGYDLPNYFKNFTLISENLNIYDGHKFELLYQCLNYVCALIFGSKYGFTALLFIIEIITLFCIYKSTKDYSADAKLTIFLFVTVDVYLRGLAQIRQCLAIALIILSLRYVINKDFLRFLFIIIIAMFFHKTAIICLPIYFLWNKNFSWKSIVVILLSTFLLAFTYVPIIKIFSIIVGKDYYGLYIKNGILDHLSFVGVIELVSYTSITTFFYLYKFFYELRGEKVSKAYNFFLYLFSIGTAFSLFSVITGRSTLFGRLVYYYFWSIIFLVPAFLLTINNKKVYKFFYCLFIVVGLSYYILSLPIINAYGLYPYQFICIK